MSRSAHPPDTRHDSRSPTVLVEALVPHSRDEGRGTLLQLLQLHAPVRLAANGAIVADQVETNAAGVRLLALRAIDSAAVTFAPDDFVSINLC